MPLSVSYSLICNQKHPNQYTTEEVIRLSPSFCIFFCFNLSIHSFIYMTNRYINYFSGHTNHGKQNTAKDPHGGTSLVVQWVRLCAPNAGGLGSIPGWGTRSHVPQQRSQVPQLRPGAA